MRSRILDGTYYAFLVLFGGFVIAGVGLISGIAGRMLPADGFGTWGERALAGVSVALFVFLIARWAIRWGDDLPEPLGGRARTIFLALVGAEFVMAVAAVWLDHLIAPGVWSGHQISSDGRSFWTYIDGVRTTVTAEDFAMQWRIHQLLPLKIAVSLASVCFAYVAFDRAFPRIFFRLFIVPWRLDRGPTRDILNDVDADSPWDER